MIWIISSLAGFVCIIASFFINRFLEDRTDFRQLQTRYGLKLFIAFIHILLAYYRRARNTVPYP